MSTGKTKGESRQQLRRSIRKRLNSAVDPAPGHYGYGFSYAFPATNNKEAGYDN